MNLNSRGCFDINTFSGITNAQLVKEQAPIATIFKYKSPAEQQSLDIAFNLLLQDRFETLRHTIYSDEAERQMFHHIVVNSVLATDSADPELATQRNMRWSRVFTESSNDHDTVHGKATLVIEHLMQLSDVGYRVQHYHLFRKWNKRHFIERKIAFIREREELNPKDFWYDKQINYFTSHVIPLCKRLDESGCFGGTTTDYVNCAMKNLSEWKLHKDEVLREMVREAHRYLGLASPM